MAHVGTEISHPTGKSQLRDHVTAYLENNAGSVRSHRVLWAAAKATIRGQLMRDAAQANSQRLARLKDLEN